MKLKKISEIKNLNSFTNKVNQNNCLIYVYDLDDTKLLELKKMLKSYTKEYTLEFIQTKNILSILIYGSFFNFDKIYRSLINLKCEEFEFSDYSKGNIEDIKMEFYNKKIFSIIDVKAQYCLYFNVPEDTLQIYI